MVTARIEIDPLKNCQKMQFLPKSAKCQFLIRFESRKTQQFFLTDTVLLTMIIFLSQYFARLCQVTQLISE